MKKTKKKTWVFTFRAAGPKLPAFSKSDFFQICCFVNGMFQNWMFQIRFSKFQVWKKFIFLIEFSVARVPRPEFCAAGISPQQVIFRSASVTEFDVRRDGWTIKR